MLWILLQVIHSFIFSAFVCIFFRVIRLLATHLRSFLRIPSKSEISERVSNQIIFLPSLSLFFMMFAVSSLSVWTSFYSLNVRLESHWISQQLWHSPLSLKLNLPLQPSAEYLNQLPYSVQMHRRFTALEVSQIIFWKFKECYFFLVSPGIFWKSKVKPDKKFSNLGYF